MGVPQLNDNPSEAASACPRTGPLAVALAGCMTLAILVAPTVGALGPFLVPEFGMSRSQLGTLTTAIFVVAAGFSVLAGRVVDAVGGRRMLIVLLAAVSLSLVLISRAPSYAWLLLFVAAGGLCQSLANPATNKVISSSIARPRQGMTTGVKQTGPSVGVAMVGLLLPPAAATLGWRSALMLAAAVPLVAVGPLLLLVPADQPPYHPPAPAGGAAATGDNDTRHLPRFLLLLTVYSLFLGGSIAAVSTYLPLYAHQALGFSETSAGRVFAVFGVAGVLGRLAWTHLVSRYGGAPAVLALLGVAAAGFGTLVSVSSHVSEGLLWVAVVGLGATTATNAVSMLLVVTRSATGLAGRASGRVASGFFTGFVVSPPLFGALVDAFNGGYRAGWLLVVGELGAAALIALALRRTMDARSS